MSRLIAFSFDSLWSDEETGHIYYLPYGYKVDHAKKRGLKFLRKTKTLEEYRRLANLQGADMLSSSEARRFDELNERLDGRLLYLREIKRLRV